MLLLLLLKEFHNGLFLLILGRIGLFDLGRCVFHLGQGRLVFLVFSVKENAKDECDQHEQSSQVDCSFFQYVRGTGTESLVGQGCAESGAESFLLGPLHENDDQQEDGNDQLGDENQVDTNVEEGGENHEWKSMEK